MVDSATPELAICAACKHTMLDFDDKPRYRKDVAHLCEHCDLPVHSATICDCVWMPVTHTLKTFCSKEHVILYNSSRENEGDKLPLRRLDPELVAAGELTAEDELGKGTEVGNDSIDNGSSGLGNTAGEYQSTTEPTPPPPETEPIPLPTSEPFCPPPDPKTDPPPDPKYDPPPDPKSNLPPDLKSDSPPLEPPERTTQATVFADGSRVHMNFQPLGSSWYGGLVGGITEHGLHIGFDDGELRFFSHDDARGLNETGLLVAYELDGGLVDNARVQDMAVELTIWKEGRMTTGRVVGVLVGSHKHGVGGLHIYCAHYVATFKFDEAQVAPQQTRRRSFGLNGAVDRKGYKTFRCGDMVQSTEPETLGMTAIVFGVVVGKVRNQMRRLLVLCESTSADAATTKFTFFVSTWGHWSRMPPDHLPESLTFDPDEDTSVISAASHELVEKMMQEWEKKPLARHRSVHQVVHAAQSAPPSYVDKKQRAAKAAATKAAAAKAAAAKAAAAKAAAAKAATVKPAKIDGKPTGVSPQQEQFEPTGDMQQSVELVDAGEAFSPLPPATPVESARAVQLRAKIAQLAAQEEEEAALLDQLAKAQARAAQRKAIAAQIQEANREAEQYGAPASTPSQVCERSGCTAAAPHQAPPPCVAASNSMTMMPYTTTRQHTPDSEKAMARRLRVLVGAQMCEATSFRAEQIAGLEFDLEEKKLSRKRKAGR